MEELRGRIRGELRLDSMTRALYATDASMYEIEPLGVVFPRDTADVVTVVEWARAHRIPLLPRGGGTSLAGQAVGAALHLDFSRFMHDVLEINREERWVRVQPGAVLDEVNLALAPHGLQIGPDVAPSNRATLGGMIGNNSSGTRSIVYGRTVDHVLEVSAVLSDATPVTFGHLDAAGWERKSRQAGLEGRLFRHVADMVDRHPDEIAARFPRVMRRVSGYNLDWLGRGAKPWYGFDGPNEGRNMAHLICGSEGTLAVVTEAKLRLVPRPKRTGLLLVTCRDMDEAMEVNQVALGFKPRAVELLDSMLLRMAAQSTGFKDDLWFVHGEPSELIMIELEGPAAFQKVEGILAALRAARLGTEYQLVTAPNQMARVWKVRKAGLPLLMGIPGARKPIAFIEDTAVAPERLGEYVKRFREVVRRHGTEAFFYAHASVGCLHIRPMLDLHDARQVQTMRAMSEEIFALVQEFGGCMSGEHGDGLARSMYNERQFGPVIYELFRGIKRVFDPAGIMNPGKVVEAQPMEENLRRPPVEAAPAARLNFIQEGGFERAVELCNGSAACRKTTTGTMCPSYMVTRDEEHSTRARANALRAVISGRLPASSYGEQRMADVFDLCIGCKACKAECPSRVDVAKLKLEFLARRHEVVPPSWRDRLLGNAAALGRLAALAPRLTNAVLESLPARALLGRLGIEPQRRLPKYAVEPFSAQLQRFRPELVLDATVRPGSIVYFPDTFVEYHAPRIGVAMLRVLEALGRPLRVAAPVCCGRPMLSLGLLDEARQQISECQWMLRPALQAGCDLVAAEPSCVAAMRDDWGWLGEGFAAVSSALFFEEFMVAEAEAGRLPTGLFTRLQRRVLLHVHCQEKALLGAEKAAQALRLVPGLQLEVVDAGCCGMAGAFGYEREHYDISMKMAERALLPAVRQASGALVVAPGVSCRQQIEHGTGVHALHPAEVLAMSLACPG
jgi:FAD/FMN-containing dehydrogenase/Fe-S oxidoreductase